MWKNFPDGWESVANGVDEFYKYGFMDENQRFCICICTFPKGIYDNQNDFIGLSLCTHLYETWIF